MADYNKAIEINPNFADAYCKRGLTYYNLKDYSKALTNFNKAIQIDPNDTVFYINRGFTYYNL